jgi:hypothetical protein
MPFIFSKAHKLTRFYFPLNPNDSLSVKLFQVNTIILLRVV